MTDERTRTLLPSRAPDEVVRWMMSNDLVAVTRRAYDDIRGGRAASDLSDLIEKARDSRYSDEWLGNAFRARVGAIRGSPR